ncbi:hydrophobin [Imleria badia]|nr:hydrophobin [Imleria badia]
MFLRASIIIFSVVALAGFATAAPGTLELRQITECNPGSIQCCNTAIDSNTYVINELFGMLRLPLPAGGTQVGFACSPLTISAIGSGSTCFSLPVCCTGNVFNGIATGCSPLSIPL